MVNHYTLRLTATPDHKGTVRGGLYVVNDCDLPCEDSYSTAKGHIDHSLLCVIQESGVVTALVPPGIDGL